jgi:hypothetical protein
MKRLLFLALTFAFLFVPMARAAEQPKSTRDADAPKAPRKEDKEAFYARLARGPSRVCKKEIAKDKQGHVLAVYIVGKSRISTALGKNKGLEIAEKRAVIDGKGRFLQWLKEGATIREGKSDETVIVLEGTAEEGKEGAPRETGRAIEKNTTKFQSVATGMIRGLQPVYYNQDGDGKMYIIVMKWSAKSNAAAAQVDKAIRSANKKPKKGNKNIPNQKGVLDDDD